MYRGKDPWTVREREYEDQFSDDAYSNQSRYPAATTESPAHRKGIIQTLKEDASKCVARPSSLFVGGLVQVYLIGTVGLGSWIIMYLHSPMKILRKKFSRVEEMYIKAEKLVSPRIDTFIHPSIRKRFPSTVDWNRVVTAGVEAFVFRRLITPIYYPLAISISVWSARRYAQWRWPEDWEEEQSFSSDRDDGYANPPRRREWPADPRYDPPPPRSRKRRSRRRRRPDYDDDEYEYEDEYDDYDDEYEDDYPPPRRRRARRRRRPPSDRDGMDEGEGSSEDDGGSDDSDGDDHPSRRRRRRRPPRRRPRRMDDDDSGEMDFDRNGPKFDGYFHKYHENMGTLGKYDSKGSSQRYQNDLLSDDDDDDEVEFEIATEDTRSDSSSSQSVKSKAKDEFDESYAPVRKRRPRIDDRDE